LVEVKKKRCKIVLPIANRRGWIHVITEEEGDSLDALGIGILEVDE